MMICTAQRKMLLTTIKKCVHTIKYEISHLCPTNDHEMIRFQKKQ